MPQADVVDLLNVVKDAVAHRVAGQGFPRGHSDEPGSSFCGNDRYLVAGFSKKPEERCNLVGCNPSPDSEDYAHVASVTSTSGGSFTLPAGSAWKPACLR
ncbi:hypothetical protein D3C72_2284180 [compost metagenome]